MKNLEIKEFRENGYLQEVNRLFFHPLGLALEIILEEDGSMELGGIWDYRDDPEGVYFHKNAVSSPDFFKKASFIKNELEKKKITRKELLGFFIQPAN